MCDSDEQLAAGLCALAQPNVLGRQQASLGRQIRIFVALLFLSVRRARVCVCHNLEVCARHQLAYRKQKKTIDVRIVTTTKIDYFGERERDVQECCFASLRTIVCVASTHLHFAVNHKIATRNECKP